MNLQDVYVLFYMREDKQQNGIIPNPALKTDLHRVRHHASQIYISGNKYHKVAIKNVLKYYNLQ